MNIVEQPLVLFVATAAIAGSLTAAARPLARRIGLLSTVRSDRWQGARLIPLLGGAAIALAALPLLAIDPGVGTAVVLCGVAAFALGLLDDFRHIAPTTKLVGQVLIASALYFSGVQVEIVTFAPLAFLMTVFWVVAIMNALNLMDNMDGLAAGVTVIAATTLTISAYPESPAAGYMAAVTAGAALGFLVHNFPPARIFMGDAGSQLLGFLLAAAALLHTAPGATNASLALLGPLAALALPIFDTALVTASRRLAGIAVTQGGRDHASHRLAALGLSDRATVVLLYTLAALLGALGILVDATAGLVIPVLALAAVGLVLFGIFLHEVDVYDRREPSLEMPLRGRGAILRGFGVYGRFGAEIALDAVLLTIAYVSAYLMRFEGQSEAVWMPQFAESVPIVVAAQLGVLVLTGVYRTLWRYLGVADAVVILRAIAFGTAAAALVIVVLLQLPAYSRVVFVLDAVLAAALLMGARAFLLWLRHWFAARPRADQVPVLIIGASENGAFAARLLARSTAARYRVAGFIDDDPGKRYRSIAGVSVVGTTDDLEACLARYRPALVVIADAGDETARERMRSVCQRLGVEVRELAVI